MQFLAGLSSDTGTSRLGGALSEVVYRGNSLRTAMQAPEVVKPSFRSRRLELPVKWYLLGLVAVAAAGGSLAGASSSPIVSTLLPLMFALIGGTGGVYLVSADLNVPEASWRLKWLGRSLASARASSCAP